ncbi:ANTAR domain-containing protein [Kitasatospora arboriphila]
MLQATVDRLRAEVEGLQTAMRTRAVIEQAKGMLAEREGGTPDQAFDRLVQLSQDTNRKLVEIAAEVVGVAAPIKDRTAGPDRPGPAVAARSRSSRPVRRPAPARTPRNPPPTGCPPADSPPATTSPRPRWPPPATPRTSPGCCTTPPWPRSASPPPSSPSSNPTAPCAWSAATESPRTGSASGSGSRR